MVFVEVRYDWVLGYARREEWKVSLWALKS